MKLKRPTLAKVSDMLRDDELEVIAECPRCLADSMVPFGRTIVCLECGHEAQKNDVYLPRCVVITTQGPQKFPPVFSGPNWRAAAV